MYTKMEQIKENTLKLQQTQLIKKLKRSKIDPPPNELKRL